MAKSPVLSFDTVAKWGRLFTVRNVGAGFDLVPFCAADCHVQRGNVKTGATGEGTAAVHTCLHGAWSDWTPAGVELGIKIGIIPPCARSCYAFRQMVQYPSYAAAMWRNTHMRRKNAVEYYRVMFRAAAKNGGRLRVNESGDFEGVDQVRALFQVAREFPGVKVWGYTQKSPEWVKGAPGNVLIRISCWTDTARAERLEKQGFYTACVTTDGALVNCPAQRKGKGKWFCADCARKGCGCCGCCRRVYFKMH